RGPATGSPRPTLPAPPDLPGPPDLPLYELDLRAVRTFEVGKVHHRAARELERTRLGGERDVLPLQFLRPGVEVRRAPADVVHRVSLARHRITTLDEDPDIGELQPIETPLHLRRLAAELVLVPGEHRGRIRSAQVDVMQAKLFGVLHHLDPRAPGILDARQREEPCDVSH